MAETLERKKKVYKVATELNLSHETLIEFLRKKGHEVKGHMSTVDDDMMRDILIHFKRDKDVAEKHQRKIQEIRENKKRAEKKPEPPVEIAPAKPEPPAKKEPEPAPAAPALEPVAEQTVEVEVPVEQPPVDAAAVEEAVPTIPVRSKNPRRQSRFSRRRSPQWKSMSLRWRRSVARKSD
jgi:hypothetical protein